MGTIKGAERIYKLFTESLYIENNGMMEKLAQHYNEDNNSKDTVKTIKDLADIYYIILSGGIQNKDEFVYGPGIKGRTENADIVQAFRMLENETNLDKRIYIEIDIIKLLEPKENALITYCIQYIKCILNWFYERSYAYGILDNDEVFQKVLMCAFSQIEKIIPCIFLPLISTIYNFNNEYLLNRTIAIMKKLNLQMPWSESIIKDHNKEPGQLSPCVRCFFSSIENAIASLNEVEELNAKNVEMVRFIVQLMVFILSIEGSDEDDRYYNEALSYLAYYIAECFIEDNNSDKTEGLELAFDGFYLNDYWDRQDALNTLGILAINTPGRVQLAYDVYYSWVNRKIIGELRNRKNASYFTVFDKGEETWRKETENGRKSEAIMHRNLAYVCAIIGDSYEIGNPNRDTFYGLAEREIKDALYIYEVILEKQVPDEESFLTYSLYGDIIETRLNDNINYKDRSYKEVLVQYEKYYRGTRDNIDNITYILTKADALINRCMIIIEMIASSYIQNIRITGFDKNDNSFEEWNKSNSAENEGLLTELMSLGKEFERIGLSQIKNRLISSLESTSQNQKEEIYALTNFLEELSRVEKTDRQIKDILEFHKKYQNRKLVIPVLLQLILIRFSVNQIHYLLRRRNYCDIQYSTREKNEEKTRGKFLKKNDNVIAYYTTLNTAKYIFEELYQSSKDIIPRPARPDEKGVNCLTVTHANYMNDPYEGLALLDMLMKGLPSDKLLPEGSTQKFRDDIYNDTFVFLKSFTNQIDKLTMWNRYASDSNVDGKNSNGCCIQFNPEMFNQKINYTSDGKALVSKNKDDYYLYRMVYIGDNEELFKSNNPDIPDDVGIYTKILKKLIYELNEYINTRNFTNLTRAIEEELQKDIRNSLRISLQSIIFLYKSDDYADENESRLLFTREFDQQDTISFLATDPPKLAIKPYMQVYIDKIIFGPNARNRGEWEPFFQYGLNKMWKKYEEITKDKSRPVYDRYKIEGSKIHYHT